MPKISALTAAASLTGTEALAIVQSSATVKTTAAAIAALAGTPSVADGSVTNVKLANMVTARVKARITGSTGAPEDATGTQITALLDTFTTSAKGLVPAASGGSETTQFLRKDGTFAVPAASNVHAVGHSSLVSGGVVIRWSGPGNGSGFAAAFTSGTGGIGDPTGDTDICTITVPADYTVLSVTARKATPVGRMQVVLPTPNGAVTTATANRPLAMRLESDSATTSSASKALVSSGNLYVEVSGLSGASGGMTVIF